MEKSHPETGITLVEVIVSLTIFTVVILAVSITLLRGMEHRKQTGEVYRARSALRDKIAEIQETANLPQDLAKQQGIGAVYGKYHNRKFDVPELPSGEIFITCHADEASVPVVLGGPQDLNFDSDAEDNLTGAGDDLRLVPMTLTITYLDKNVNHSITTHRLITRTSNR